MENEKNNRAENKAAAAISKSKTEDQQKTKSPKIPSINAKSVKPNAAVKNAKPDLAKGAKPNAAAKGAKSETETKPGGAKRKFYKPRYHKNDSASMNAPKKIKLLLTIVNRQKTEFFVDLLHSYEINMQMVLSAQGTANDDIMSLLGLTDSDKSVIISVIRQDKIKEVLSVLEDKFNTVRGGKGIACTIPIKSAIGVAIYRFLSNTSSGGLING